MSVSQTYPQMDIEQSRFNMMEQQIRPWDVLDQNVLDRFEATPRELFVPPEYKNLAYADIQIPYSFGQVMLEPRVDARLIQALKITPLDNILEIGTGTGFTTAILAQLGRSVTSVDYYEALLDQAAFRLKSLNIDNTILKQGDASKGYDAAEFAFDVIFISGRMPSLPDSFKHILNRGGRLVVFTGNSPTIAATLIQRSSKDDWTTKTLFEADAPTLIHCEQPDAFTF